MYTIGPASTLDGRPGFSYSITVNNLTVIGWRAGTRAEVEEYAKQSAGMCVARAKGDGITKVNKNNKNSTSHLRGAKKSAEAS